MCLEIPGINPLVLYDRPPIDREPFRDIAIGEPCVSVESPTRPPGVSDEERSLVAIDRQVIVISHSDVGVSTIELAIGSRKSRLPCRRDVHVFVIHRETK